MSKDCLEKYEYEKAKFFFDTIYHDTNFNGHIMFCRMNRDGKFYTLKAPKTNERNDFLQSLEICKSLNYYYTLNQFMWVNGTLNRDTQHIFSYGGVVIDIDCHKAYMSYKKLSENLDTYIRKVDLDIALNKSIPYTMCVKSGMGIQFIYVYEKAISYKLAFIQEIMENHILSIHEKIVKEYSDLGVELDSSTTKRKCGLFRMPYTYNTKTPTKQMTSFFFSDYDYINVQEIIDKYSLIPKKSPQPKNTYTIAPKFQSKKGANKKRCKKIVDAIFSYQKDLLKNLPYGGHENRNRTCLVLANFLLNIMPYEQARIVLFAFNDNYREPLTTQRLTTILDYCNSNFEDEKKIEMNYRYFTNAKILEYLNLQSGDYGIVATKDFIYNPCYQSISEEEREEKRKAKAIRNTQILEMLSKGHTYDEIAKEVNTSISTISRICNKNRPSEIEKHPKPWEVQGISRATYYRHKKK